MSESPDGRRNQHSINAAAIGSTSSMSTNETIDEGSTTASMRRRKRTQSSESIDNTYATCVDPKSRSSGDNYDENDGPGGEKTSRRLQMCRKENIAIPVVYFIMGMTIKLPMVALREYMRKVLRVDPDTQTMVLQVLATMPWHLKLFFAFLSDSLPIAGQRRKPYITLGVLTCGTMWTIFGGLANAPGLVLTSFLLFGAQFGLVMTDVNVDAVVVERVSEEKDEDVGTLQGLMWRLRYLGAFTGMISGGLLLDMGHFSEQQIFLLVGFLHLVLQIPFVLFLAERTFQTKRTVDLQTRRIFEAISDKQIYQPLLFLLFSGVMPSNGDAFANFLLGPLKFTDFEYASIAAVSIIALIGGITIYDTFLRDANIHRLFYIIICVQSALKLTQLILVYRVNTTWGINDYWFSFGDEVINDVFNFMLQMPILIFAARVCPKDVEGSVYAFLTMAMNVSGSAGNTVSSILTHSLGITLTNFDRLGTLTVICATCNLLPMLFVHLLPSYISDVKRIARHTPKKSRYGAVVLACVLLFFLWSLISAFVNIAKSHGGRDVDSQNATRTHRVMMESAHSNVDNDQDHRHYHTEGYSS